MNTHDTLFKLENVERFKALTHQLMKRSSKWCVLSDAALDFPCCVEVKDNYSQQSSTLVENIQVNGVWQVASTTVKQLQKPSKVRNVTVVTV